MKRNKTTGRRISVLLVILAISVILRLGAAFYLGDQIEILPGVNDQISYHTLALRLLGGHGFTFGEPWWPVTAPGAPTAHWSFLYTFYLTFVYSIFGPHPIAARMIQVLIVGILQPYLAYKIGARLFQTTVGLFAAGLTALYPYFIYYSATLMTEPFFILATLSSLWIAILLMDRIADRDVPNAPPKTTLKSILLYSLGLGLCLSAAVLLRQLFMLFIPILIFWMWLANQRKFDLRLGIALIVPVAMVIAVIVPFTRYNYSRFHRFVLLNTNSGYVLFWANHPIYGTHFIPILPPEMGTYLDLIPPDVRKLDEAALDQELLRRGIGFITEDPVRYILLSLSRIPTFFMFWPSQDSGLISNISRVGGFGLLLPFILYGLVRSMIPKIPVRKFKFSSPLFLLFLFIFFYTVLHLLTWALVRYRLPIDALFMIFAGLAFVDLLNWVMKKPFFNQKWDKFANLNSSGDKGDMI